MDKEMITAVIAAASALAGVALSQLIALLKAHLDRKHQRQILLRTKYEELANHLNDSLVWADHLVSAESHEKVRAATQPMSARRIYVLALLYFPRLKHEASDYVQASIQFQRAVSDAFSSSIGASAGAQAVKNKEGASMKASRELNMARQALDNSIEEHAGTYISA